ncbi:TPA: glutathione S-transferase [Shigella flexneri]|uniref:glutathione S-transferase n=1 Tax=Shigella flexneri TaxID=623 RepID=UPI00057C1EF3|nr:glutathione S-transferase [Shigella flexneri]EFF9345218.1 glutathione S-transferase [Escherichia coli]EAA0617199.1 glutathione S-transferase [Shigella flexneri]EAA1749225.1 glutathione S-transferase [Shigella flexneri]EFG3275308.1 glutathione S-transferase [Escherichia coli]EFP7778572.1 glutathione S-transferase [Shigella flexneri]
MKLVGSYTSPFVRKLSILLLEKGITFEFINELPYNADNGVAQFNPLGKVLVLVTEEGECWFDSPIIAEYIELMNVAPAMLPRDPLESLRVRKIEALADGIMDAGLVSVREQARPAAQQSEDELLRQREKINRSLDVLEGYLVDGTLKTDTVNLATIAIACAVGYLNFRRVAPGWCVDRPHLVKLVENLFSRESFACTKPPKA